MRVESACRLKRAGFEPRAKAKAPARGKEAGGEAGDGQGAPTLGCLASRAAEMLAKVRCTSICRGPRRNGRGVRRR